MEVRTEVYQPTEVAPPEPEDTSTAGIIRRWSLTMRSLRGEALSEARRAMKREVRAARRTVHPRRPVKKP